MTPRLKELPMAPTNANMSTEDPIAEYFIPIPVSRLAETTPSPTGRTMAATEVALFPRIPYAAM